MAASNKLRKSISLRRQGQNVYYTPPVTHTNLQCGSAYVPGHFRHQCPQPRPSSGVSSDALSLINITAFASSRSHRPKLQCAGPASSQTVSEFIPLSPFGLKSVNSQTVPQMLTSYTLTGNCSCNFMQQWYFNHQRDYAASSQFEIFPTSKSVNVLIAVGSFPLSAVGSICCVIQQQTPLKSPKAGKVTEHSRPAVIISCAYAGLHNEWCSMSEQGGRGPRYVCICPG